eukprot:3941986-Rhodomonas_salina.4
MDRVDRAGIGDQAGGEGRILYRSTLSVPGIAQEIRQGGVPGSRPGLPLPESLSASSCPHRTRAQYRMFGAACPRSVPHIAWLFVAPYPSSVPRVRSPSSETTHIYIALLLGAACASSVPRVRSIIAVAYPNSVLHIAGLLVYASSVPHIANALPARRMVPLYRPLLLCPQPGRSIADLSTAKCVA